MTYARKLTHSACIAVLLAGGLMAGSTTASAQQTIGPASATPVPGPMPDVLANYVPVTTERLRKPEDEKACGSQTSKEINARRRKR